MTRYSAEKMRKVGGDKAADGFLAAMAVTKTSLNMSVAERKPPPRRDAGVLDPPDRNTLDRATAMMPRMLYDRLDEFGADFAIVYPTAGLRLPRIKDDETRRAVIHAYNIVSAEYFRETVDRMTPAAIIPMHTPEEAIAELEYRDEATWSRRSACSAAPSRDQVEAVKRTIRKADRFAF